MSAKRDRRFIQFIQVTEFPLDGSYRHPDGTVYTGAPWLSQKFGFSVTVPKFYRHRPEPSLGRPVRSVCLFIHSKERGRWFYAEADLAPEPDLAPEDAPSRFPETWTGPDGRVWGTRNIAPVAWPRLLHLRVEVTPETEGTEIPGNVRAKKVLLLRPGRNSARACARPVWVYLLADCEMVAGAPDYKEAFRLGDRQQATKGEFKGQSFISPRLVAERFGVELRVVQDYQENGMPFVPRIKGGPNAGQKHKPRTEKFKHGYYGRELDFWLESDADRFVQARKDLPEAPPEGLVTITQADEDGDIGRCSSYEKRKAKLLGEVEIPLAVRQKSKNGKEFVFTSHHRTLITSQVNAYRKDRTASPVHPGRTTAKDAQRIFRRSSTWVYDLVSKGSRHLGGAKVNCIEGNVLSTYTDKNGHACSQLKTDGYLLLTSQLKTIWEGEYPGKPWPLDEQDARAASDPQPKVPAGGTNGAPPDHTNEASVAEPRKPGRQPGWRKPGREEHKVEMLDAWDRQDLGDNKAAYGRKYGFARQQASTIINAHEDAKASK